MTMETVTCAECGDPVPLDTDHAHIIVEKERIEDRDERDDYYFHVDCRLDLVEDWFEPA
jgi:hypothetical protein